MAETGKEALKQQLFAKTKQEVVRHLQAISNQGVTVPIANHRDISVKDLAVEVEAESEIGIEYMIAWMSSIEMINSFRRGGIGK